MSEIDTEKEPRFQTEGDSNLETKSTQIPNIQIGTGFNSQQIQTPSKTSKLQIVIFSILAASLAIIIGSLVYLQFFGPNQTKPFGAASRSSSSSTQNSSVGESSSFLISSSVGESSSFPNSLSRISTIKYAEAVANGAVQTTLNSRSTPCGDLTTDSKPWGFSGQVSEGPITQECLGGKYTWWKVKWGDGTEGWSIADNLKFYDAPLAFNFGFITGEFTYPSDFIPPQRACAKNIVTKAIYCTDRSQSKTNPKVYKLAVPVGKYYVFASRWDSIDKSKPEKIYYDENVPCGLTFDCFKKTPNPKPIAVEVKAGLTTSKIDPTDWYVDETVGGYYRDF
ncbi:MAG: hypothetical protein WCK98_03520 [bacterium]